MMLQGVAVLHLQPGVQWVHALQDSVLQRLERLRPRDISQVGVRAGACREGGQSCTRSPGRSRCGCCRNPCCSSWSGCGGGI